jgi:ABC-type uncharacterized transport system auxiliary subunit
MRAPLLLAVGSAVLAAACINVDVGVAGDGKVQTQFLLADLAPKPERRSAPIPRRLLVTPVPSAIGETFSIAYSRAAQQRSFYQFASWTDRPSMRIVRLLVDRIEARGLFNSVALLGNSVGGDLLLNVAVVDVIHDVTTDTGRIEVQAELIERRGRRLVERQRFSANVPVAQENAPAAVDAMSRAITTIFDELMPWLERTAETLPAPTPR